MGVGPSGEKKELVHLMPSFYQRHYADMQGPLLDLMLHGIRTDEAKRSRRLNELTAQCIKIQDNVSDLVGYPLFGPKSLSNKKIAKFLYDDLHLPKKTRMRKHKDGEKVRTVTADEVAIRRLINEHPKVKKLQDAGQLILQHRRKYQLSTFYRGDRVDDDGRMRSSYAPYAETGRNRSSANPCGTGSNAQNIDREARDVYIPDEGCVFVEVDLSLAEDRDVKVRTGSPRLIEQALTPPWEMDSHKDAAVKIFRKPVDEITKDERYIGKRSKHDSNYAPPGQGGAGLSDALWKEGYSFLEGECQRFIDTVREPEVVEWQKRVRLQILQTRSLATAWGRVIDFQYDRLSDDLYRRGYAYCPQSDISDWINQWGFIPASRKFKETGWAKINAHEHDSLLFSAVPKHAYNAASFLRQSLERTKRVAGVDLKMWCELKVGMDWGNMKEYKRWPSRKEFEEAMYDLHSIPSH